MSPRHRNPETRQLGLPGTGDPPRLRVPACQQQRLQAGGGRYIADYITAREETALLAAVDAETWLSTLRRRVQHYGYRYDYSKRKLSDADRIGDLPSWIEPLCDRLCEEGIFVHRPEQLIVNEYEPGQGINSHADNPCFGEVVASLSLGSDCLMDMDTGDTGAGKFSIVLKQRSLLILRKDSRKVWQHAIASRKSDEQNGIRVARKRRVSLTFRTIG